MVTPNTSKEFRQQPGQDPDITIGGARRPPLAELRKMVAEAEQEQRQEESLNRESPGQLVETDGDEGQALVIDKQISRQNQGLRAEAELGDGNLDQAKALEALINGELDINDPEKVNAIAKRYLGSNN